MTKNKVDYKKIYEVLKAKKGNTITASMLAHAIGVEKISGATMSKLAREGWIEAAFVKGYWMVLS